MQNDPLRRLVRLIANEKNLHRLITQAAADRQLLHEVRHVFLEATDVGSARRKHLLEICRWQGILPETFDDRIKLIVHTLNLVEREEDYYELLHVDRHANPEEIKRAFRQMSLASHPDMNPDDPGAGERFRNIRRAYEVLGDDTLRKKYDYHLTDVTWRESPGPEENEEPLARRRRWRLTGQLAAIVAMLLVLIFLVDYRNRQSNLYHVVQKVTHQERLKSSPPEADGAPKDIPSGVPKGQMQQRSGNDAAPDPITVQTPRQASRPPAIHSPSLADCLATACRSSSALPLPHLLPAPTSNGTGSVDGWRIAPKEATVAGGVGEAGQPSSASAEATLPAVSRAAPEPAPQPHQPVEQARSHEQPSLSLAPSKEKTGKAAPPDLPNPVADLGPSVVKTARPTSDKQTGTAGQAKEWKRAAQDNRTAQVGVEQQRTPTAPQNVEPPREKPAATIAATPRKTSSPRDSHKDIEDFLHRYVQAYQKRNPDSFLRLFEPDAIENGEPVKDLASVYTTNFQRARWVRYQIQVQEYTPCESGYRVEGRFRLLVQFKNGSHVRSSGAICLILARHGDDFRVKRLDYAFE